MALANLKKQMGLNGTGFAAVVDGVLDIRTTADNARTCAVGVWLIHYDADSERICDNEDCDCVIEGLKAMNNLKAAGATALGQPGGPEMTPKHVEIVEIEIKAKRGEPNGKI